MSSKHAKKAPPKVENMTEEQLQLFIKKKRECEDKAQSIVMALLDNTVKSITLIEYLPFINQNHYEDIVVERAIIKKCGYPICDNALSDKMPKQTFKICTSSNKVFDITARKNFCSNACYKSSVHIQNQILTSPLWYREKEDNPKFNLLPLNTKGVVGEVIDLSLTPKINLDKEDNFTSLLDFTKISLDEMYSNETKENDDEKKSTTENVTKMDTEDQINKKVPPSNSNNKSDCEMDTENAQPALKKHEIDTKVKTPTKRKSNFIIGDVLERKSENRVDPILSAGEDLATQKKVINRNEKSDSSKEKSNATGIIFQIEKCLGEWFGMETLLFLFGELRVKEMMSGKNDDLIEFLNKMTKTSGFYSQYNKLVRKLNFLELEDKKYDSQHVETNAMKPLPDYSILKEEGRNMDIKVNAFLRGEMTFPKYEESKEEPVSDDDDGLSKIPLVDTSSQPILRRKIVLNKLDKMLPDLLQALNLSAREISGDIGQLIETFNLQAHNITFKTMQWNIIAIIIIKLLSIKGSKLKKRLKMPTASNHLNLMLLSYELDSEYLDRLVWWLTDVDRILQADPVVKEYLQESGEGK